MTRYAVDIDLDDPNLSHTQVVDLVGVDRAVLDLGCAAGALARVLTARGCTVSGVEGDVKLAEDAREHLDRLVVADLDSISLTEHFDAKSFDVVVLADVLEHLREPRRVLEEAVSLLADGGRVVLSVPNVAHGSVRLALLQGSWRYTETGLLDATHLHFFTRESLIGLLDEVGLGVEELRSTVADPMAVEVDVDGERLPATIIEWVRHQRDALDYQFVVSAGRASAGEDRPPAVLHPAVAHDVARLDDRWTDQMRAERETRHRLLTTRDHVIGLEARASAADDRLRWVEGRLRRSRARANRLQKQVREMQESATWRVGRLLTRPFRRTP